MFFLFCPTKHFTQILAKFLWRFIPQFIFITNSETKSIHITTYNKTFFIQKKKWELCVFPFAFHKIVSQASGFTLSLEQNYVILPLRNKS